MTDFSLRKDGEEGGLDVYSKAIRAGRRTYFFDVKSTRNGEYYLIITESRKKQGREDKEGTAFFEKQKIYLYKEDFNKFVNGMTDVIDYIKLHNADFIDQDHTVITPISIDEEFDNL